MYAFAFSLQKLADRARSLFQELSAVDDSEAAIAAWFGKWHQLEELESQNEFEQGQLAAEPKPRPGKQSRTRKLIEKAEKERRLRALRVLRLENCQQTIQLLQASRQ